MKTIVLDREFVEVEIRPGPEFDEYAKLVAEDVQTRLAVPGILKPSACPGCSASNGTPAFEKLGLSYVECSVCGTLYVSPRPDDDAVAEFYRSSKAVQFWRKHLLAETRDARREKIFRPRARWVIDVIDQYRRGAESAVVAGYHNDLLVDEIIHQDETKLSLTVANPIADREFTPNTSNRLVLNPQPLSELRRLPKTDVVLAFDLLDRCADVEGMMASARSLLRPGGLLLATVTLATGFDVQALWDRAAVVLPPERLNLFSVNGLMSLVGRHDFTILELSTPGVLDVEIVQRAIRADPSQPWPRVLRQLVEHADADAVTALQEYLQRFRLSSFGRVVLRAPAL